jgi:hypothetical protein
MQTNAREGAVDEHEGLQGPEVWSSVVAVGGADDQGDCT